MMNNAANTHSDVGQVRERERNLRKETALRLAISRRNRQNRHRKREDKKPGLINNREDKQPGLINNDKHNQHAYVTMHDE
jgi:hypothetical protein